MKRLTLAAVALVAVPAIAHADRRSFSRTYEYMTMPEGQTEVEVYSTWARATWDDGALETHQLQLEIEHGLTDRWDVSLYHAFDQASGDLMTTVPMHLSAIKLRSRYRFAERGELPVDVLLYGEVARTFGASAYVGEAKAVLARDFGQVTVAANLIGEVEFGGEVDATEVELGWAAGATYELSPTWKVGAESWGDLEPTELDETISAYAGPAASWAASGALWVTTTAGFGLTSNADKFTVRAIIGMSL
ncbi:MAG: hypothetical protein IPL61_23270 [Myxococcales bacterium]|nr:hypothetical protein [Myxococcales bacterium]